MTTHFTTIDTTHPNVDLPTGANRSDATGKGRFDLISPFFLLRLAKHYENGGIVHGDRNWEKGVPFSRCFDSAVRHLTRYLAGENNEDHLAAAVWNIACIMDYEHRIALGELLSILNDLPRRQQAPAAQPAEADEWAHVPPQNRFHRDCAAGDGCQWLGNGVRASTCPLWTPKYPADFPKPNAK